MRHRSLIALALATIASVGGTRLSAVAIPWLVLTTTNSPVLTGAVAMAELLPYVVAQFLAGPYIDRLGARKIAIFCDLLSCLLVLCIPLLFAIGLFSVWVLIPVVALLGMLRGPSDISKRSLVPVVARAEKISLERVTGILGTSDRLAATLGVAVAGVLIAAVGPILALFVNAATFLLSALLLIFAVVLPKEESHAPAQGVKPRQNYLTELASGVKVVAGSPVYLGFAGMMVVTNMLDHAYGAVMLPVWVRENGYDVSWMGILLACFSSAAILGAAVASIYAEKLPRKPIVIIGFMMAGPVPFLALALSPSIWCTMGLLFVCGFGGGFLNPVISAALFERVPRNYMGRMVATFTAMTYALMPFGGLFAGSLVELSSIRDTLIIAAILYGLAVLLPFLIPGFSEFAKRRTMEPMGATP